MELKIQIIQKKGHLWLCQCDCGNTKVILGDSLRNSGTISCGCVQKLKSSSRKIDLSKQRFDKLLVQEFAYILNGQTFWKCICDCGKEKIINGASLRRGSTKSCGCLQGNYIHGMWGKSGYKKVYLSDPVKKLKHAVGVGVRDALKKRKSSKDGQHVFDNLPYTPEELKKHLENLFEPWMNWDNYGGKNNGKEKTWHIDHIIPQNKFEYYSMKDNAFIECWSLNNLRPLEKNENMGRPR